MKGVGAAKVTLCLCAAIWTSVKTVLFIGSFTKLVSLTSGARWNREHIPLFAVGEDICYCFTQTLLFFLSTIMLCLVLSAGGSSEEEEGSWQVWYFFLGFEGQPPACFLFYQRCCVANQGDGGHLLKSEEAVCVGYIEPEIAIAMLNFIFDCWIFRRHLVTCGNLVHKSFLSIGYLSNKYRKSGPFLISANFSLLGGIPAGSCTNSLYCWRNTLGSFLSWRSCKNHSISET